jgi:hypothetical protein
VSDFNNDPYGVPPGAAGETATADSPDAPAVTPDAAPAAETLSPAFARFRSCRWQQPPEDGREAFCTHRDVLPFAGKNDFKADSWCPECAFYKLRRTPKKRDWAAERANNY